MLSNVWIALLFSFGSAGWIFAKTQKSTAGQTKTSFIIASVAFAAIFIVMTVILDALFKK
jgi:hypothetical protein